VPSDSDVLVLLGRIEGKLDSALKDAEEHRDDDKRRFTEIHKKLDEHAEDINKAKGAKATLLWIAGGLSALVGAVGAYAAKALGLH